MNPDEDTLLFVYGTLKRGGSNHAVLADQTFVGDARTPLGYRLYHVADYPGLIAAADDTIGVTGEVWSVTPAALDRLDAFEGLPQKLFRRDVISLLPPFDSSSIETYIFLRDLPGVPAMASGTWPVHPAP